MAPFGSARVSSGCSVLRSRLGTAVDAFLSSSRLANPNTRRAYAAVLDRVTSDVGADKVLAEVSSDDLAEVVEQA